MTSRTTSYYDYLYFKRDNMNSPDPVQPRFPTYLLPSFSKPFRARRQSSASSPGLLKESSVPSLSTSPTSEASSSWESAQIPNSWPPPLAASTDRRVPASVSSENQRLARVEPDTLRCSICSTDLAYASQIVSKGFTGRYGRAYLVSPPETVAEGSTTSDLANTKVGKSEQRVLVTGSHTVADINCATCGTKVGWKYIDAKEEAQKYKIGKFILETHRVVDFRSWEDVPVSEIPEPEMGEGGDVKYNMPQGEDDEPHIFFDSDDEDECEDVFLGQWDPQLAARRRSRKVNKRPKQPA